MTINESSTNTRIDLSDYRDRETILSGLEHGDEFLVTQDTENFTAGMYVKYVGIPGNTFKWFCESKYYTRDTYSFRGYSYPIKLQELGLLKPTGGQEPIESPDLIVGTTYRVLNEIENFNAGEHIVFMQIAQRGGGWFCESKAYQHGVGFMDSSVRPVRQSELDSLKLLTKPETKKEVIAVPDKEGEVDSTLTPSVVTKKIKTKSPLKIGGAMVYYKQKADGSQATFRIARIIKFKVDKDDKAVTVGREFIKGGMKAQEYVQIPFNIFERIDLVVAEGVLSFRLDETREALVYEQTTEEVTF